MTDKDSGDNSEEKKTSEFYKEKDVFGLEKPTVHPKEKKAAKKKKVSEEPIPDTPYSEYQSVRNFCILIIFSFNFYQLIWFYKHWRYLRYEKQLNIMPALRAISTIFVGYSFFRKFYKLAREKGYKKKPALGFLFVTYLGLQLCAFFPNEVALISLLSFVPLLPVLRMMNFYYLKEQENYAVRKKFSRGEKRLLLIIWAVILFFAWLEWSRPTYAPDIDNYYFE